MRTRVLVSIAAVGVVAVLGLSACGQLSGGSQTGSSDPGTSDLSWDAQALQSIGFSPDQITLAALDDVQAAASASPSAGTHGGAGNKLGRLRHRLIRFGFGKRLEHGEATVQTDDGTKTVVVQRGQVTAITDTSVTVKSADGFTLTWTFGNPFAVIKDRAKIQPNAVAV